MEIFYSSLALSIYCLNLIDGAYLKKDETTDFTDVHRMDSFGH